MTYQEKVDNSTLLREKTVKGSKVGVTTKSKRIKSLIVFLVLAAYTIASKFIFNSIDKFDIMYVVLIANLVFLFILTLISKSVYQLNHFKIYQVVFFLSRLCKLIIFISAYIESTSYFINLFREYFASRDIEAVPFLGDYGYFLSFKKEFYHYFFEGIINKFDFTKLKQFVIDTNFGSQIIKYISREISIVLFIPVFLYFFFGNLTYIFKFLKWTMIALIPGYNIYYYFRWLLVVDTKFVAYQKGPDDTEVIVEYRQLHAEQAREYIKQTRIIRIIQSIVVLLTIAGLVLGWLSLAKII